MDVKERPEKRFGLKNIIAVIVFAVLVFFCIMGVYRILKWKDTTGDYISSVEQLSATSNDLMDVVFVGSSHCYCDVNPAFFWEDMGISVFDMAVSGQDKDSAYYHLKNLLKTQSPNVVFIDMYAMTFDEHAVEGNIYRNLLSLPFSVNSVKLVTDYAEKDKWADYIARFPVIHTRYRELTKYDFVEYAPNRYGRGERMSWHVTPGMPQPLYADADPDPADLSEKNEEWLNRLLALSEEEGFIPVFTVFPFTTNEQDQHIIDSAALFAEEHGIEFLDLNRKRHDLGLDYDRDFVDTAHLNARGARKVADYLESFISSRYSLPDHRGDKRYHQWDEDLSWYRLLETENRLTETTELSEYVKILGEREEFLSIISLEGTYVADGHDYYPSLSKLGMTSGEYGAGGKWIFENGTLTKAAENDADAPPYILKIGRNDTLRIKYEGDYNYPENVMIGRESYHNKGCYLCITVYDKSLEKVVESKIFW